jgi:hypothetical protein
MTGHGTEQCLDAGLLGGCAGVVARRFPAAPCHVGFVRCEKHHTEWLAYRTRRHGRRVLA